MSSGELNPSTAHSTIPSRVGGESDCSGLNRAESLGMPEWSVTDLSHALKATLEDAFRYVRVRGEISGYRGPQPSGHVYFSLKDLNAKIDAIIWKGVFARLKIKPQEGLEVVVSGKITAFPGGSRYQIMIDTLQPSGVGALMAILAERQKRLAAEGLFDSAHKRALPFLPRLIGIITSPTGAVIRDIIHRLEDRFPRPILIWPVRVQGEGSAEEVAAAIQGFSGLEGNQRPDLIIVARGGGSLEDLWGFNDEHVVRAAAACPIPLISAIGHEVDWTLLDYVADWRAPTPTAAAERAVPVRDDLIATLSVLGRRYSLSLERRLETCRIALRTLTRMVPDVGRFLIPFGQRLDRCCMRYDGALRGRMYNYRMTCEALERRLQRVSPAMIFMRWRTRLTTLAHGLSHHFLLRMRRERELLLRSRSRFAIQKERWEKAFLVFLEARRSRLLVQTHVLEALSYKRILERGFALVYDKVGSPVRSVGGVNSGELLSLELYDGKITVLVQ
jgi:exodeoxyribonuclease VII large subunit